MNELDTKIARNIINSLGSYGTPPEYGVQYFTVGLEPYLSVIEDEYLSTFIKEGGSSFKTVVSIYGGGKTHFLYNIRDIAWKNNFVVSYVRLSPGECPFHRLEMVYKAIVQNLLRPLTSEQLMSNYERGIKNFIKSCFSKKYNEYSEKFSEEEIIDFIKDYADKDFQDIESISFYHAIKGAYIALLNDNDEDFNNICLWLNGEGFDPKIHKKKYRILQKIDKTTAFSMIRSLVQYIKIEGYSGLVILFDEAENIPSLSTKNKEIHLNNLREIIDECGNSRFQNVMIFYAVPDYNFLETRGQIYEALKQRISQVFDDVFNPSGVKIDLEKLSDDPKDFLNNLGDKIKKIYEKAYQIVLDEKKVKETINIVAEWSYEQRYGDMGYKRLFVQNLIKSLHFLKSKNIVITKEKLEEINNEN